MITPLKPYPSYSPSRVPWLNHIPVNWSSDRIASLFRLRKESGETSLRLLSVYLGKGVVPFESVAAKRTNVTSEDLSHYQIVEPGDFVLNNQQAWRGSVGVSAIRGITSPAYLVLRPIVSVIPEYISYLSVHPHLVQQYEVSSRGVGSIQRNLYWDSLRLIVLPLPPLEEQEQIVRFVRQLDSRVNRLIKAKRRLIELLNEQKQAIIHQAVTRGLDPTVPLKPSGIDWLGDIPEHWRVRKVRHVSEMLVSNVDKHSHENEEVVRLCNYVDVYKNEAITDQLQFMVATASKDEIERFRIKIGDVIITKDSELWSDIGVPAVVRHEADDLVCGYHLAILRPNSNELSGEFLLRCLQDRMIATQLHVAANGITRYGLSQGSIKSCLVPVPPMSEQQQLVKHTAEATHDLTMAISKSQAEIELIREYRTRLVADVVTGQLDVRQHPWANTEIEDPTEPIPDDAELEDDLEETDDVLEEAGV